MIALFIIILVVSVYYFTDNYKESEIHNIPEEKSPRSFIRFYFYPSPFGIDWSNPKNLLISTFKNQIHPYKRILGHVAIEAYSNELDNIYYEFTSMTDRRKDAFDKLFIKKIGLGMVLTDYPGKLENTAMLQTELKHRKKSGRVNFITYEVNPDAIKRVKKYLTEYREFGVDKVYGGLTTDPRYKTGAGCMPFSRSVSEIAGLDKHPSQLNWPRIIRIPHHLNGFIKKVSVWKLFTKEANHWAKENEDHTAINFWDLDKIFKEILNGEKNYFSEYEIIKHHKSYEIKIDAKKFEVPNSPIWLA